MLDEPEPEHAAPAEPRPARPRGGVAADLARPVRVLGAAVPVADLEVFFRDPELACVAVRDDDERMGLITRARFGAAMAGRLGGGRAAAQRAAVGDIADWAPLAVAAEASVADIATRAMRRNVERRYDEVLVRGERWGALSPADLVGALVGALTDPAVHDPLTRLPGRVATWQALARRCDLAAHNVARVAVVLLDVRDMTATNTRYGLAAGDALLAELAGRLVAALPEGCEAGRVDGDRFAVLATLPPLAELHASAAADGLRQRMVAALATPTEGIPAAAWPWLHSSVAWTVAGGSDPEELVLQAETRLRRAKEAAARPVAVPTAAAPTPPPL